jgi:hypothetical protein
MRSRSLALVAVATVGVYLAVAVPWALHDAVLRVRVALGTAGMPVKDLRSAAFGPAYVSALERIRRFIGRDEPYLVDETNAEGSIFWVRYDLLPRRAIAGRTRSPLSLSGRDCWEAQVRWQVVGMGKQRPPLLIERPAHLPPGCPPAPWWKPPALSQPGPAPPATAPPSPAPPNPPSALSPPAPAPASPPSARAEPGPPPSPGRLSAPARPAR